LAFSIYSCIFAVSIDIASSLTWSLNMKISLAQLTLTDVSPAELVDIAATIGCDHVCLFPAMPVQSPIPIPTVADAAAARSLRARMESRGISAPHIEALFCRPGVNIEAFAPMLEMGAILGANRVTCLNYNANFDDAVAQLNAFCSLAESYGLVVAIEFTPRSATRSLAEAVRLLEATKFPSAGLVVDVLHLIRSGGAPADLAQLSEELVHCAQISDGPLTVPDEKRAHEALYDRQFPGEGEFPLVEFVQSLPRYTLLAIEVPAQRLAATVPPLERAQRALKGTRRVLEVSGLK
jgi:sugar phosphate isomerase/epimerase